MSYHHYEPELPRITLTYDEFTTVIQKLLSRIDKTFDFNGFIQAVAYHFVGTKTGFKADAHTSYDPKLQWNDIVIVREIIWDFIILRYVSVGGYGTDVWPALSITQRGKDYFEGLK